jgi:drug/metabolite transporter (DMT)-like permease
MSARAWAIFATLSLVWGIPYLFIKLAVNGGVTPGLLAWGRVVLGALVLLAWAARAGTLRSLRGHWRWLLAYAIAEIAIPFPLIAAGEQRVTSSLAAIIIAAVPLLVALLALRFDRAERASGARVIGLVVGMGGVVVLVGIDATERWSTLLGSGMILLAAVGYAAGPMILKRHLFDLDPRAAMGAGLGLAALLLTPVALLDIPARVPSATALVAIVVLGVVCTAVGFALMAVLVFDIGPGRALVVAYINPVVAVALGVVVLGEQPGAAAVAGLLLILAGSWLSTGGRLPPGIATAVGGWRRPDEQAPLADHLIKSVPAAR